MKKRVLLTLVMVLTAVALFAAGTVDSGDGAEIPNQVFIGTNGMTGNHLIPIWATSNPQYKAYPLILPALTWFNDEVNPIPDLAETIEVNDEATSYTFTLPMNAEWSDGVPLTADDVYFTYKLAVDDAFSSSVWPRNLADIKGLAEYKAGETQEISGIVVLDDHTVRIDLVGPNSSFLYNTYLGILPKHILENVAPEDLGAHPYSDAPTVTSGPYDFVEYVETQYIHMKKKADYWGDEAQIEDVFIVMFEEDATMLAQLAAGELDIAAITQDEVDGFRALNGLDVEPIGGIGYMVAHVDARTQAFIDNQNAPKEEGGGGGNLDGSRIEKEVKPYLQNKAFRQALAYAIDIDSMIDVVTDGYGMPIYSPIFGPSWAINPNLNTYDRDLERATSLMMEAGVEFDESGNALWEGERIVLICLAVTSESNRKIGEFLQQQFGDVGIRLDIKMVTSSAFITAAIAGEGDLIMNAGGRFGADPSVSSAYYTTTAGWASLVMGYSNVEFDALMVQGKASGDINTRAGIYHEASAILNDELPSLFFMTPSSFIGRDSRLKGVQASTDIGYLTWNIVDWYFAE